MKKLFLILPILLCLNLVGYSQTSNIKIIDLTVNSITYADTSGAIITDSGVNVNFKISDLTTANKALILIGTQQNLGDVKSVEATFTQIGSNYYLSYSGNQYMIVAGMANINIELNQTEQNTYNYITVYVEDNQTNTTTKLYFNKQ